MKSSQDRAETAQFRPAAERNRQVPVRVSHGAAATRHGALQAGVDQSPRMLAQRQVIEAAFGSAIQRQPDHLDEELPLQAHTNAAHTQLSSVQDEPTSVRAEAVEAPLNLTGMPSQLKAGIESLSGMDMSDVRVHRNSGKPAQLNALAYAQGNDIHLGPGQEQHLPHEAWHVVQQAQGRVAPTRQMEKDVAVNDDAGLEHEADVMGERALQMQTAADQAASERPAGLQALGDATTVDAPGVVQRIALYHGSTIEDANKVVDGVDPSKGKGEFGQGFYTVFASDQAKHIAMYYWDKEKKYNDGATGIAVVKMSIPDNWWAALMNTSDDRYKVTHSENERDWSMLKHQADPREGNDAEEALDVGDTEHEATEGKPWFLPRNAEEDVEYQDEQERNTDLGHDIIVGPIKDKQTPYLQVVFGSESASYLLGADEVTRAVTVSQPQDKAPFGTGVYNPIKAQALEQTGSLVETPTGKIKRFREGLAGATNKQKRLQLLQNVFGGMEDKHIPDEMAGVFAELNVPGDNKGEQAYNYYDKGVPG